MSSKANTAGLISRRDPSDTHTPAKPVAPEWSHAEGPTMEAFTIAADKLAAVGWLPYTKIRFTDSVLPGRQKYLQLFTRLYNPLKRRADIYEKANKSECSDTCLGGY